MKEGDPNMEHALAELIGVGLLERAITSEGEAVQASKALIRRFSDCLVFVSKKEESSKFEDATFAATAMMIALLQHAEEKHGQVLWTKEQLKLLCSILLRFEPFGVDSVRSFRSKL